MMSGIQVKSSTRAFTLIELLCVLVIISLFSGLVVIGLAGPLKRATNGHQLSMVSSLDQLARLQAKHKNTTVQLTFDLDAGLAYRSELESTTRIGHAERLTNAVIMISSGVLDSGTHHVIMNANGTSESYAVGLQDSRKESWILIAGQTGQATKLTREEDVDAVLQVTRPDTN